MFSGLSKHMWDKNHICLSTLAIDREIRMFPNITFELMWSYKPGGV